MGDRERDDGSFVKASNVCINFEFHTGKNIIRCAIHSAFSI